MVRNVNRVWFSMACLPCKRPGSVEIFDQDEFQSTWMNFDTLRSCYSANGAQVTLLTSGIYKHMKRAATHLFKRQSENRVFFSKLSNFYFDLRPPGKTEERKPDPRGN